MLSIEDRFSTRQKIAVKARLVCMTCSILAILGLISSLPCLAQTSSANHITDLIALPGDPEAILVATSERGVFRSLDKGDTWQNKNNGLPSNVAVQSFAFSADITPVIGEGAEDSVTFQPSTDERVAGVLFAGTRQGRVFYSPDMGDSWHPLPTLDSPENIILTDIAVDERGQLLAGTQENGVLRLESGEWTSIGSDSLHLGAITQLVIAPQDSPTLYAIVPRGIYQLDQEERWQSVLELPVPVVTVFLIDPIDPKSWYLGTSGGLMRSVDEGKKWLDEVSLSGMNVTALSAMRGIPSRLYVGTSDGTVYTSSDQGTRWDPSIKVATGQTLNKILISPSLSTIFVATDESLHKSEDQGASWHPVPNLSLPPTPTPTLTPSLTPTLTPSPTSTTTVTPTPSPTPTATATPTPTPTPTPSIGTVIAVGGSLAGILIVGSIAALVVSSRSRPAISKRDLSSSTLAVQSVHETRATQVQAAFDSLRRHETGQNLLDFERHEVLYVDYRTSLKNLLRPSNDYVVGQHGTGKTILFLRGFTECRRSWVADYAGRSPRYLKAPKALAIYVSLKEYEFADHLLNEDLSVVERQLIQTSIESLLEQGKHYPPPLNRQLGGFFSHGHSAHTCATFLDQIGSMQHTLNVSTVHLLIDDFSNLDSGLQVKFATVFRRLILANRNLYLKLAVVPGEFDLDGIQPQRDMFELSLDPIEFVKKSPQPQTAYQNLQDVTETIIQKRLSVYTQNRVSWEEIVEGNQKKVIQELIKESGGIPRRFGLILSQTWQQSSKIGYEKISVDNLWKPRSPSARRQDASASL